MTRRTTTLRVSRVASLLAACALAASLASCGRSDPVQEEIDRVSVGLGAISTSGSSPSLAVQNRKAVYQWVVDRMSGRAAPRDPIASNIARPAGVLKAEDPGRPATQVSDASASSTPPIQSSNPGQAAAANLLLARGYAGLGEIASQEAALAEGAAALHIGPITAALDQWLIQNAEADALAAYDPSADLSAIERQIGEKQKLADEARAAKDRQLATIADLEKQAELAMTSSRAKREQAAEIRSQATNVSETTRLELITQSAKVAREADSIEKDAATYLATVGIEKPKADMLQRGIDELTTQIQLMRTDKDNLRQRAERNAAASKRARDESQGAATRIAAMAGELSSARESVAGPSDAAIAAYEKAAKAARTAGQSFKDAKGQAGMVEGNYQHALAGVLAARARGHHAYAEVLAALARAKPALPGSAELSSKSAEANTAAAENQAKAKSALTEALTQYKKAAGTGDTQNRLDALEASLSALLDIQPDSGEEATPVAPDAPDGSAAQPMDDASMADLSGVEVEVRSAIDRLIAATKAADFATVRGFLLVRDEAARPAFEMILDVAAGPAALEASCQRAYGKSLKQLINESSVESVKSNPMIVGILQGMDQLSMGPGNLESMSAADATISPKSATEATVTFPAGPDGAAAEVITVVKDGDDWKIDMDSQLAAMGGAAGLKMMAPSLAPMKAMGTAFTTVAGKVDGGGYADVDSMLIDLNKELTAAMMKAGGFGQPGGGAGGG